MDYLRSQIWDFLFRADRQRTVADIAEYCGTDEGNVREAILHDWFDVVGDKVTIAYSKS